MIARHTTRWLTAAGSVGLLVACADDAPVSIERTRPSTDAAPVVTIAPAVSTAPDATVTTGPTSTPTSTPASTPTSTAAGTSPPAVAVTLVGSFDQPVGIAVRPNDPALYVIEQSGRIVRAEPGFGSPPTTSVFADLTALTAADGERGLLGAAFSPDGDQLYVDYTDLDGNTVIAGYPAGDGPIDGGAARIVLEIDQPYANHNGGDILFGPDRMLYIATGDGGSADDPQRRASDVTSPLGKILRIDVLSPGSEGYSIPDDNPFASGVDGLATVWAWGVRNPWRIAIDSLGGDLWIADVGQNRYEEIDHLPADGAPVGGRGADLGWSAFEADVRFNPDVENRDQMVPPVHSYEHGDDGCSISGGAVYRGAAIPTLTGMFVYSDYCSGIVWAYDPTSDTNHTLLTGNTQVSAVRAGPDGELYVLELGGDVFRVDPPLS